MQSVDRAVSILQCLARHGSAGVTVIAQEVGVHKSTVFRLLSTLEARGLVEQDVDRGRYHLGHALVQLAAGAAKMHDVAALSRPICQELAAAVGDTVNVVIHDGLEVITIDQVIGDSVFTSADWVGQRGPLHATAAGKVFLAAMEPRRLDEVLARGLERFTPHTIVDADLLREDLRRTRERGFAVAVEEHQVGLVVVAAPIRSADGLVAAAMTIGGPRYRLDEESLPGLAERVVEAAARASWRHGYLKRG